MKGQYLDPKRMPFGGSYVPKNPPKHTFGGPASKESLNIWPPKKLATSSPGRGLKKWVGGVFSSEPPGVLLAIFESLRSY